MIQSGIISLKSNFHKKKVLKDGLCSSCEVCIKDYYLENCDKIMNCNKQNFQQNKNKIISGQNENIKSRTKIDIKFRSIKKTGCRIHHALKGLP